MDGKEVALELLRYAEHSAITYQTAVKVHDICKGDRSVEVQVEWDGLPDSQDRNWAPLIQVHEDLPAMLEDFLHTVEKLTLKRRACSRI